MVISLWPSLLFVGALAGGQPPNVIVILVDDLGIDQLACYDDVNRYTAVGCYPYAYTPNIDALAAAGVRFRQARATPLCSPTRAALMSGRYGRHTGCGHLVNVENVTSSFIEFNTNATTSVPTIADRLNPLYSTGMFGKLHLHQEHCPTTNPLGTGDIYPVSILHFDNFAGIARNPNTDPAPKPAPCDPNNPPRPPYFSHYIWIEAQGTTAMRYLECGCPCPTPV